MLRKAILIFLFSICYAQNRKISLYINPGCSSECHVDKLYLIHVTADGPNDTLHHVWDFTYKPTVILGLTPLNTTLSIDWSEFLSGKDGSINFSETPQSVLSFVINQIIEFNDANNTATFDPKKFNESDFVAYDTNNFEWKLDSTKTKNISDLATAVLEGKHHENNKLNGSLIFSMSAFGTLDHSHIQPHLFHTVNATQIDVVLDELSSTKTFKSRFALALTMASQDTEGAVEIFEKKSLDDEHSPGVFTIGEVKMPPGYLIWRSVAYTSKERSMTDSTIVYSAFSSSPRNDSFSGTAFPLLFGNLTDNMILSSTVFSFGQPGEDDYYTKTKYLSWTFLGGVGETAQDNFSLLVELVTIFGIGLPAALIFLGISCIFFKRISKKSHDIVFAER